MLILKQNITSLKNCLWNDIYRLAWEYWFNTEEAMLSLAAVVVLSSWKQKEEYQISL